MLQAQAKTRGDGGRSKDLSSSRHRDTELSGSFGVVIMDARTPHLEQAVHARGWRPERCDRVALVLQDGGALGAYQAGVYQALHEAKIEPDWVCGVSIGAINSAIIAGNPPERRLERLQIFWDRITSRKIWHYTPDGDIFR